MTHSISLFDNVDASDQSVAASYAYDEFGNLVAESGTLDQPYRFSTKRYYDGIGLSYYGYRFYSASLGRWITRDPLGISGGLNLYGFVGNGPMNGVDAWGLIGPGAVAAAFPVFAGGAAGATAAGAAAIASGPIAVAGALGTVVGGMTFVETTALIEGTWLDGGLGEWVYDFTHPEEEDITVPIADVPTTEPDDDCGCKDKLSKWQLDKYGIDAHKLKREILGKNAKISRYELCKCKSGEIVIRDIGCTGPSIPTGEFIP